MGLEWRRVRPFYLKMTGLNALGSKVPFRALNKATRRTTDGEVAELLASHWRARVMGAWLASGRAERLEAALLESLETSQGSFTSPPLATVALHGLGARAVPSLMAYLQLDLDNQWGSASFMAAVLERVDVTAAGVAIDDEDRQAVDGMLGIVRRLAQAAPQAPR